MTKLLQNSVVYSTICVLFALAIFASITAGGSVPAFGTAFIPQQAYDAQLSSMPVPPPDPQTPPVRIAAMPVPPPDPQTPPVRIAAMPAPPPDPQTPPAV